MDRAYDVLMCVEILAEQLLLLEVVDKMNYQCPACSIPVNPVAFESGCKVRPYFKILPNVPHKNDCFIHGMSALVSVGLKKSIKKEGLFPIPYPNKLILPTQKNVMVNEVNDNNASEYKNKYSKNENVVLTSEGNHNRTYSTLGNFVKQYINFPYDRDLFLNVPFVNPLKNTYKKIFQKLHYPFKYDLGEKKIFYGILHFKKEEVKNDLIVVTLLEGERDANTKKILKNYVLHIDTKNWSEKSKSYVLSQLQFSRNESIDAATLKKPDKAYIFFLGERESLNDFKFHVNDHRLIYSIVTTITY